jgi:polysaccharide export outer membrane protein
MSPTSDVRWVSVKVGFAGAALATALLACGAAHRPYDYRSEPDPRTKEFEIGPLDQLSVVVWKNQDLSGEMTVRPDGVVTLPLIGHVRAAGRTPTALQAEISRRLAEFIRSDGDVAVSVAVAQVNSYHFTVSGNVEKPGYYESKTYVTAVEAVALAGGPNKFAGDDIFIVRGTPVRRIPIDLARATSGASPEQNLVVLRGDVIVVP